MVSSASVNLCLTTRFLFVPACSKPDERENSRRCWQVCEDTTLDFHFLAGHDETDGSEFSPPIIVGWQAILQGRTVRDNLELSHGCSSAVITVSEGISQSLSPGRRKRPRWEASGWQESKAGRPWAPEPAACPFLWGNQRARSGRGSAILSNDRRSSKSSYASHRTITWQQLNVIKEKKCNIFCRSSSSPVQ